MLKGLPASGKSTWAKEQVRLSKGRTKRVNKDDLRAMIDAGEWSKTSEKHVLEIRDQIVTHYLSKGYNVIVDDTNLSPKHEETLRAIVDVINASAWTPGGEPLINFEVKWFDTPLAECIRRDMLRPNPVGKKVIRRFYEQIKDLYEPKIEYNPDLPECIIVDIDGTLAHMNGRSPYDYTQVHTDVVDPVVADIVRRYRTVDIMEDNPLYVIIVSGREDSCKPETEKWLQDNHIPYDELHMRKSDDDRDDRIVKKEIFDAWINNRYNVKFVLDDRNRVVEMWRSLGLKVLQVGEGDF
jgi:predicted kinase